MQLRTTPATALALFATLGAAHSALASNALAAQADGLRALVGEWNYVEDRTEGRNLEQRAPPMSSKFSLRSEEDAVVLVSGHGSGHRDVRIALDTSGKMVAFEYLRIVERDGGLVYSAQPGGASPTEFVLTEWSPTRAVFENPRHDYPKRIMYELSAEGGLGATIGFSKGGTPRRFEFKREGS